MLQAIVDTHAVIWYIFADSRLSITAQATIEQIAADGDTVGSRLSRSHNCGYRFIFWGSTNQPR